MNEAETRAELIDPKLKACGWGVVEDSKILREYNITAGRHGMKGMRIVEHGESALRHFIARLEFVE